MASVLGLEEVTMWEEIFNKETLSKIIGMLGEDKTEDLDTMNDLIEYLSANVEIKDVITLSPLWVRMDEIGQTKVALSKVDLEYASRFMILMDYVSAKGIMYNWGIKDEEV